MRVKRIGVVGYGNLGKYLVGKILEDSNLKLVFVWNRNITSLYGTVHDDLILENLFDIKNKDVDLIVEVAHPEITINYGKLFLEHTNFLIGSPTALADSELLGSLLATSMQNGHAMYVATGALWGAADIRAMAEMGTLQGLKITMIKHPTSLKVCGELIEKNEAAKTSEDAVTLYTGSVGGLCALAPNNVNTMAVASIAASNLGFRDTQACLISDSRLVNAHIIEVEVEGSDGFRLYSKRVNPARLGSVTGHATYDTFFNSIKKAHRNEVGLHIC